MVLGERASGRGDLDAWCVRMGVGYESGGITHRPDVVVTDAFGADAHLIIDVKTLDVAGASHIASEHTDSQRGAAHRAVARRCVREYGVIPARSRLVPFVVSTFGALGEDALSLLAILGRRVGAAVPIALLDVATWATPRFAPLARMAVTTACRRGLAGSIAARWHRPAPQPAVAAPLPLPAPTVPTAFPPLPMPPAPFCPPAPHHFSAVVGSLEAAAAGLFGP